MGISRDAGIEMQLQAPAHRSELPVPPEELVEEVPEAYRFVGLPVDGPRGDGPWLFFTPNMSLEKPLYEGERNSDYIDCGSAIQGERADLYSLEFVLATRLRAAPGGGTIVESRLEGRARDRFTNERPVFCSGTGKLEAEIAELLRRGGVR
jgi:hypothetical protein